MKNGKQKIMAAGLLIMALFPPMRMAENGYLVFKEKGLPLAKYPAGVRPHFILGVYGEAGTVALGHMLAICMAWVLFIWILPAEKFTADAKLKVRWGTVSKIAIAIILMWAGGIGAGAGYAYIVHAKNHPFPPNPLRISSDLLLDVWLSDFASGMKLLDDNARKGIEMHLAAVGTWGDGGTAEMDRMVVNQYLIMKYGIFEDEGLEKLAREKGIPKPTWSEVYKMLGKELETRRQGVRDRIKN